MDNTTDWTATALFSPSKARAQQAQAKDWASVESWLSKRYASKRLPPFERNEETLLQALLALATLNESADEQRALVDRVEKAALQSLSKRITTAIDSDLQPLFKELDGNQALNVLAETAVCLDSSSADVSNMAEAITDLTASKFSADQQLHRVDEQIRALKSEQRKASDLMKELKSEAFQPESDLAEQTVGWTRDTKHLKAKISEHEDRLSVLRAASRPKLKLEYVLKQADDLSTQRTRLDELELETKAFQNLPSDTRAARAKLESARDDLRRLTKRRDELFEGMLEQGG